LDYRKWLNEKLENLELLDEDILTREKLQREWAEHYKKTLMEDGALDKAFYAYLALRETLRDPLNTIAEREKEYKDINQVV
jgi:phosphoenolpyruvate synthase/pyruvate phosphate dikinase